MLGPDLYNGSPSQLAQFQAQTGATYPLLQQGGSGPGDENLFTPYGTWDNYAVINKQGILRYLSSKTHPHGDRYYLNEIRGCVDSLVSQGTVGVEDPLDPRGFRLRAAPNPFRSQVAIELSNPSTTTTPARVTVHDLVGREVATLWSSELPRGVTRLTWDGRSNRGTPTAPGVYLVLAQVGDKRLGQRIVRIE